MVAYHYCWGWGWMFGFILFFFVIWMIVRNAGHNRLRPWKSDTALDILKERYAKGEIGKEEFDQKSKDLI
jgi:putative membrane protein